MFSRRLRFDKGGKALFVTGGKRVPQSRTLRLVCSAFIAIIGVTMQPSRASAHDGIRNSAPANGAVVGEPVGELRLEFAQAPDPRFLSVELSGPGGALVTLGPPVIAGAIVAIPVTGAVVAGKHTISWRVVGRDGHPVLGEIVFTYAGPLPAQPLDRVTLPVHHDPQSFPASSSFSAESPVFAAIRFLQFVSLLSIIGAIGFYYVVLGRLHESLDAESVITRATRTAATTGQIASLSLILVAALRLAAQSRAMHGEWAGMTEMRPMIIGTIWGMGWLLQLGGAIVAAVALLAMRGSIRWWIAAAGALALAVSASLSGHAASASPAVLTIIADALHIVGAGGWLGTLLLLLVAGVPAARHAESGFGAPIAAAMVNAFSRAALIFATIVGVTGVTAAWIHVGSIAALFSSTYGNTLLLKLGTLTVVVFTGAYNWLRVRPALGTGHEGIARLRRSATVELLAGVIVLVITAVLVATPTPLD